jgi:hypothetical protein
MTQAQLKIKSWRENPIAFVYDNFKVEPDAWQRAVLNVFPSKDPDKLRISLQACVGPGKSCVLAWCGWNFLTCYGDKGEHPKGAALAVTADNLKDNLWPEFSKWQERSDFLKEAFIWTKQRIYAKDHPETWFISARSFSKTANPEEQGRALSGLHSKYVLYLLDESGDMAPSLLKSAEQGLSNCEFGKIMQAGNPTSIEGILHLAATTQRDKWHVVKITSDPDNPNRTPRVSIDWAREQIKTYGRDNPWVMATILGQFPPTSINQLLGIEEVEAAMSRKITAGSFSWAQKRLGIDVARFGDDRTVLFPRQGLCAFKPVVMRHNPSVDHPAVDIANRVMMAKNNWGQEREYFDDTVGWAHGAIDICRASGLNSLGINFASTKTNDPRYYNVRAELWMNMADWIRRGGKLPRISELIRELTAPTYTYVNGKFLLERKDQIKERIGVSPDLADGLALTFAEPDQPAADSVEIHKFKSQGKLLHDYNPFDRE